MIARVKYDSNYYPKSLNKIVTNPGLIFVFDDVLPSSDLEKIKEFDWVSRFWKDGYNSWPDDTCPVTMPYANKLCGIMVEKLKSINKKVKILKHIGSYYVLKDHTNELLDDNIHRDYYDKKCAWSGVFHLMGNSGDTIFYPNFQSHEPIFRVNFQPGRLIIFPSLYAHQAGKTNPGSLRLVHTVRLLIKGKINEHYF